MIKSRGFEPVLGEHLYTKFSNGYNYAGTEKERTKDINWALNDTEIRAVWASRGGYGCQHLIQHLKLKKLYRKPEMVYRIFRQYSHTKLSVKKGFVSIHGQTIKTSSFGVTNEKL